MWSPGMKLIRVIIFIIVCSIEKGREEQETAVLTTVTTVWALLVWAHVQCRYMCAVFDLTCLLACLSDWLIKDSEGARKKEKRKERRGKERRNTFWVPPYFIHSLLYFLRWMNNNNNLVYPSPQVGLSRPPSGPKSPLYVNFILIWLWVMQFAAIFSPSSS